MTVVSAGIIQPVPVVSIGGKDLRPDPAGAATGLVVIDDVQVTWGRADVMEQPTPAYGRLRVLDLTNTWATATDRRGQLVTLRWEATDPATGTKVSAVYFRGRIGSPVTITTRRVVHPTTGATVRASVVELPLQSILVDLANRVPTVAWPAETLGARVDRVKAEAIAAGALTDVVFRDYWRTPLVAPVAAADQVSVLDHLMACYDSAGVDRMTYRPDLQRTENLLRRWYSSTRGLAGLAWDPPGSPAARAGQGVYARSYRFTGGEYAYLDAAALERDPGDGIEQPPLVTLVQVNHPDSTQGYARVSSLMFTAGSNEAVTGRRMATLESLVADNGYSDVSRNDLESIVRTEGGAWRVPPLHYSTRKTGGFETLTSVQLLLAGAELNTIVFLQRSELPALGLRPVFGIIGGTIAYARGGWELDLNVTAATTLQTQHFITWSEIDDGTAANQVEWWDDDNPKGMHESLSLDDLGFVSTGLNVTVIPDNIGWDFQF